MPTLDPLKVRDNNVQTSIVLVRSALRHAIPNYILESLCLATIERYFAKGMELADEGGRKVEYQLYILDNEKGSQPLPEKWEIVRPNPCYYEGQILSLLIHHNDENVMEVF